MDQMGYRSTITVLFAVVAIADTTEILIVAKATVRPNYLISRLMIRIAYATGEYTQRALADRYLVTQTHISAIIRHKRRALTRGVPPARSIAGASDG
jgi:hypothetical protein